MNLVKWLEDRLNGKPTLSDLPPPTPAPEVAGVLRETERVTQRAEVLTAAVERFTVEHDQRLRDLETRADILDRSN